VHRDVKPSNVRITPDGRALLLDFGLAFDVSSASLSRTGQMQGTLFYASPEQVTGGAGKVDARTDIWSLGVTLYEGLTGRRPFEGERTEEVLHGIVTTDPVAPRALLPDLPRDVETVVLKALEKAREARYASAAALASDLDALLAGRPIQARPSSGIAKAWKWSRRKPAHALSLTLGALLLVGGPLTWALVQARHARALARAHDAAEERADELEQVAQFQGKVVGRIRPARLAARIVEGIEREARAGWRVAGASEVEVEARARSLAQLIAAANTTNVAVTALHKDLLEPALVAARTEFADRPRVQGKLLQELAITSWALGLVDVALQTGEEAVALFEAHVGPDDRDRLLAQANLGQFLFEAGRITEAEPHMRAAVEGLARTHGAEDPRTLLTRQSLALLRHALGDLDECDAILEDVLAIRRRVFGDAHAGTLQVVADLGSTRLQRGRLKEAEPLLREAWERYRAGPAGGNFGARITLVNNVGALLRELGDLDSAAEVIREGLELARTELGDRNPTTTSLRTNLAQVLAAAGRLDEAEPLLRESVATSTSVSGPLHENTLFCVWRLGEVLLARERAEEALAAVRGPCDAARAKLGADAAAVQRLAAVEVRALVGLGRHAEAATALVAARPASHPEQKLTEAAEALFAAAPTEVVEPAQRAWRAGD
jgi:tetratricopeptide (TPR) repeat protein